MKIIKLVDIIEANLDNTCIESEDNDKSNCIAHYTMKDSDGNEYSFNWKLSIPKNRLVIKRINNSVFNALYGKDKFVDSSWFEDNLYIFYDRTNDFHILKLDSKLYNKIIFY